jgi:transposase
MATAADPLQARLRALLALAMLACAVSCFNALSSRHGDRSGMSSNRVRKGARGGQPPKFDRVRYKQRNQVERLMNRRKQFRAVAMRYDELPCRYQATVTVADISSGDAPGLTSPDVIRATRPRFPPGPCRYALRPH